MPSRTLAIGDIHGCFAQFEALLDSISLTASDHLILLGDYVDRGPDSARVLARIIELMTSHRVTPIMGNHEQMMLAARDSQDSWRDWMSNGGDATLRSYAGARATLKDVLTEHWEFLQSKLVPYFESDTHIFVHANAYPDVPMEDQPDYMLRWERCDQIAPHMSEKVIVCGHTPQKSGQPMNRGFAVCIDTHACGGRNLTCLDAASGRLWQADASSRIRRAHLSDFESS